MLLNNYFKNKLPLLAVLTLLIGLTSCGSYQYVGQDSDGIYGPSDRRVEYREVPVRVANADAQNNNSYYKNYFKEKSLEYENESLENEIFTDIDSYEGNYALENDSLEIAYEGYGGWGQNSSEVSINVYPNYGFNNYWWHRPYYAWGWGGYYGPFYSGWGYGFNSFYWHSPYYGGYYGSFYNPYYYYRSYRYSPYYNNRYYGNRYYSGRGVAYNTGRRGSSYNRRGITNNRNSNFIRRNSLSTRNYSSARRPNVRSNTNTTRRSNTINNRNLNNTTRTRANTNATKRRNSSTGTSVSRQRRSYNNSSSTPSRSRSSGTISRSSSRSSGSSTRRSSSSRPSSRRR